MPGCQALATTGILSRDRLSAPTLDALALDRGLGHHKGREGILHPEISVMTKTAENARQKSRLQARALISAWQSQRTYSLSDGGILSALEARLFLPSSQTAV